MKIKPPFSSSSNSLDFGCVSAILRHLRCRHRISISDDYAIAAELSTAEMKPESPNIVARLMGLDSMPILPNSNNSNNSLSTSSSPITNNLASFCEKPIYLREESEEFLILTFNPNEDEDEEEKNLMNWGKCESIAAVQRKKRRRRIIRRKLRREKCVSKDEGFVKCGKNINGDELPLILDLERIKMAQRKVEFECSSQNSSPVSVLELPEPSDECPTQPNSPNSDLEEPKPEAKQRSSRRKLSSNFQNLEESISASNFQANEESNRTHNCRITLRDQMVLKRSVEEDFKNSTWVEKEIKKPVRADEIAAEIGFEILDALVSELTSEMCLKCLKF